MSYFAWIILFFFVLTFLVLLVYVLVVKAFYWGDKKEPTRKKPKVENRESREKSD